MRNIKSRLLVSLTVTVFLVLVYYLIKVQIASGISIEKEYLNLTYISIIGLIISFSFQSVVERLLIKLRTAIKQISIRKYIVVIFGLLIGLLLSILISKYSLTPLIDERIILFINITLIVNTIYIVLIKEEEIFSLFVKNVSFNDSENLIRNVQPRILDTSVIIDGRIFDIYIWVFRWGFDYSQLYFRRITAYCGFWRITPAGKR